MTAFCHNVWWTWMCKCLCQENNVVENANWNSRETWWEITDSWHNRVATSPLGERQNTVFAKLLFWQLNTTPQLPNRRHLSPEFPPLCQRHHLNCHIVFFFSLALKNKRLLAPRLPCSGVHQRYRWGVTWMSGDRGSLEIREPRNPTGTRWKRETESEKRRTRGRHT